MILIVGTIRVSSKSQTGKLDAMSAMSAMSAMISASRAEQGCVEYVYAFDVLDPELIHVKELWTDRAALDAHFRSEHLRTWRSRWDELEIGERCLVIYDVGDPEPI